MAIHYLTHDWLNVPIDDLKSVNQFILLDAVASSAPIGESGEIEPFQTLLVAELLERVRHLSGATLDAFDDFGGPLGVCIARGSSEFQGFLFLLLLIFFSQLTKRCLSLPLMEAVFETSTQRTVSLRMTHRKGESSVPFEARMSFFSFLSVSSLLNEACSTKVRPGRLK